MNRPAKIFISLLTMLACFSGVVQAATVELSLNLITPPGHLRNKNLIHPWIEQVKEKSGGTLIIKPYYAASMAPMPQAYEAAVTGIADISEGLVYATPGVFPLTEMISLPDLRLGFSTMPYCLNMMAALREVPEVAKEWKDTKVLWLHSCPPAVFITSKKQIKTVEDLKGLKMRVSGSIPVRLAERLGCAPVGMDTSELYHAMEKGVVDGALIAYELLYSRRLNEVTKYVTLVPLVTDAFFMVMNKDAWDALSPEHKKVMEELSGDWGARAAAMAWDKGNDEAIAASPNVTFYTPDQKELERFQELFSSIKYEYADSMEKKGLPGRRVLEIMMRK